MGQALLVAGALGAVALAGSLLAGRLRVPGLLLFLAIGMAVGSDGLGLLHFDDYELARDIGVVALAVILYEGGLSTDVAQLRPVAAPALSLAVVGTVLTALITGAAATLLFELEPLEGMLLASIVASTDVAAIFGLLRGSGMQPRLATLLEGEAGSNDPVAILLVIGLVEWLSQPDYDAARLVVLFAQQVGVGAAVGLTIGPLAVWVLRRMELPTVGLYPVASLTVCALAFGVADVLGGSGFLSIYLAALVVGSAPIPARRTIGAFHDGLAWVAQLAMFLTLGLLVFPSQLGAIALEGTLLALVLTFVARPVASLAATAFARLTRAERIVLAWAGLRGAVPIVLATFPVIAGIPDSLEFFNIVFFAVVLSLVLQGTTFAPLARRLGVTTTEPVLPEPIAEVGTIRRLGAEVVEFAVRAGDAADGALVRELDLPREAVVNVIIRGDEAIPPRGSTRLRAGDHLHLLVRREASRDVARLMERWRRGPLGPPPRHRRAPEGALLFTVRRIGPGLVEGEVQAPTRVLGREVVARLRVRRDEPGALVALEDGRYALVGRLLAVGSRADLARYTQRRAATCSDDEALWLQTVVGALAVDAFAPRALSP
jgi:cell volume regulation protein A